MILIQTRWHEDDLAGRIVAETERGGEPWDIVSLPAEAEPGDLLGRTPGQWLWDDAYGYADFLRHEKATQLPRNWSALYQQRPAAWLSSASRRPKLAPCRAIRLRTLRPHFSASSVVCEAARIDLPGALAITWGGNRIDP